VVERWLPRANKRVDAFGFGDVLAVERFFDFYPEGGAILIQCTSTSNAPSRVRKMKTTCRNEVENWLKAGNKALVWGWSKRGPRGKRKTWQLKEYPVTLEMLR
jgi:hypothetical protein